jgi:hypothetical protein
MPLVRKAPRGAIVVRAVAFGDADGSVWAAGLDAGAPALIAGGGAEPVTAAIDWRVDGPDWMLSGADVSLTVTPVPEPERRLDGEGDGDGSPPPAPAKPPPEPEWSGQQELCRVTGTLAGTEVDQIGTRTELEQVRAGEVGSIRGFSGWVGGDAAVTLLALRSASASDHEEDLVAATVFDPDGWMASIDPRLSTTYDGDGNPTRATLELWVSDGERELPRRAAGEAAGPLVTLAGDGATLAVLPLRYHSRGSDGAGIYLLASC